MRKTGIAAALAAAFAFSAGAAERIWLDETDLSRMEAGWGRAAARRSIGGNRLTVKGRAFDRGVGTHAVSSFVLAADGRAIAFDAKVGLDDEIAALRKPYDTDRASVKFIVYADGRAVAESPVLEEGADAFALHADLRGAKKIELFVCDAFDGEGWDHADWCEAYFTVEDGAKLTPSRIEVPQYGILTPRPPASPRINGPRVYGVRPGHPIIYRLPVSGVRPMAYAAADLPPGVSFDAKTGILTGAIAARGDYAVRFTARNAEGVAEQTLTIRVGDRIALTPPMGWNSWNCFAHAVTAKNITDTADVFDRSELANHGWCYVNVDDYWQNKVGPTDDETLKGPMRNADGTIAVNKRFPSMKALADYVHAKGFKIGLYSSPGPYTCGRCAGSWKHEWLDARTYADWGYDYLKYDWCGYGDVARDVAKSDELARNTLPYRLMGEALRAQNRDIVFSLCQYGMCNVSTWGENVGGNCWRTTGDITDTWGSLSGIIAAQAGLWPYARPGAWNDPDMLILGRLGWGNLHPTRLTPNEQYTHMSMWCVLCAPLLIGCDLTQVDDFTMSLLTNDEVLETNQDPLGAAAARVSARGPTEVWAKPMSDGSLVFALFNRSRYKEEEVSVDYASLGLEGDWKVRDLWRQRDLGVYARCFATKVLPHATALVRLFPADGGARLREGLGDIRDNSVYVQFQKVRPVDKPGYVPAKDAGCADCPRNRRK